MQRTKVFISYSHQDKEWLNHIRVHLKFLELNYDLVIWDDTTIGIGSDWLLEIQSAIRSAKVAILLVSANFLASDFINKQELPPLLHAAKKEGAKIFPIILSHCMFQDTEVLSKFQSLNSPERPLIDMNIGQRDAFLVKLTREIRNILRTVESNHVSKKATKNLVQFDQNPENIVQNSLAITCVFWILSKLSDDHKGLTITRIHQLSHLTSRKVVYQALTSMESNGIISKQKINENTLWRVSAEGISASKEFKRIIVSNFK